jgi:hypothetical protein
LARGKLRIEPGKSSLVNTRNEVRRAWVAIGEVLAREGQPELAAQVGRFVERMQPPLTDREHLAAGILKPTRARVLPKTPANR